MCDQDENGLVSRRLDVEMGEGKKKLHHVREIRYRLRRN